LAFLADSDCVVQMPCIRGGFIPAAWAPLPSLSIVSSVCPSSYLRLLAVCIGRVSHALAYRSPGHKTASLVGDSTNSGTAVTAAAYTCHQGLENRPTNLLSPEREFLVFSVFRPFHPLGVVRTFMGETASTTQTLIIVSLHLDNGEQRNVFCVHGSSTCLAVWLWRLPGPI
jgi:hypothetical protein